MNEAKIEFFIPDKEKLDDWKANHECKLKESKLFPGRKNVGAIGGQFTYSMTPTTLGCIFKVKCACGAEIDLTEYDW